MFPEDDGRISHALRPLLVTVLVVKMAVIGVLVGGSVGVVPLSDETDRTVVVHLPEAVTTTTAQ
jgi:hypothetical protein